MEKRYKVVLWGAGLYGKKIYRMLHKPEIDIIALIDNDPKKSGREENDIMILQADSLLGLEFDYLIITPEGYRSQIKQQCLQMGVSEEKIIDYWDYNIELRVDFIDTFERDKLREEQILLKKERDERAFSDMEKPIIHSAEELLNILLKTNKSLVRFGDGEFELMQKKKRSWFQNVDEALAVRLKEIIRSNNENILVAIADNFGDLNKYTEEAANGIAQYLTKETRTQIMSALDISHTYYDAYVSRPYMIYKDKNYAHKIFSLLKQLWHKKNILIVEGESSRMGIGNDLFSEAGSIRRVVAPAQNAFEKYDEILHAVIEHVKNDELILISLGPTATVLAFDLALIGKRAIDIGQIDNEYDWFLAKAESRIPISGKAVAELSWCRENNDITEEYRSQIIMRV